MSCITQSATAALLAIALAGCQAQEPVKVSHAHAVARQPVMLGKIPVRPQGRAVATLLDRVVWNAQKQQGKMYRWGGASPTTGFDCSGLTQYAFRNGAQISLPRTAAEQYATAVKVSRTQSRKGDLVFFNTSGSRVSHVGIYLGNDTFLHAPRSGKAITTSALAGYWGERLVGFGRIPGACRPSYS